MAGCLTSSWSLPVDAFPLVVTIKNISRHCQMSLEGNITTCREPCSASAWEPGVRISLLGALELPEKGWDIV